LNYKQSAEEFIEIIKNEFGIDLNCGIGTGKTARSAAKFATRSLDTIREIRDSGKEKPEIYEIV
jgi:GTP cyclohydrolase IIa